MALKVWLPLNGTLENIGVSGITMSGTPASWGNGKIGKCATFTGNVNQRLTSNQTNELDYTDNFSWCMWVNPNYTSGSTQYVFTVGRADGTTYGYGANIPSATSLTCRFGSSTWGVDVASNEWTHVAFTKQGTSIKIYKNGELKINQTFSGTLPEFTQSLGLGLGYFYYSGGNIYPFFGSLNDFRIYDHCLSAKEVKEISQGLVLHYKLDGWSGGINQNLALDTANKICTATGGATSTSLDYGLQSNYNLIRGKKITISADIILENAATSLTSGSRRVGFEPAIKYSDNTIQYMGYWIGLDSTPKTLSGRYSTTVTVQNKDFQSIAQNGMYIQGLTSGTATIKNIKVELGDTATPWSPAPEDLGIDTTKITDSSGYGNNGNIIGELSIESGSSRYTSAIHIGSTSSKIHILNFPTAGFGNSYTFAWWAKVSSVNPMHWGFSDGIRLNGMYTGRLWNTGDGSNNPLYTPGTTTQVTAPTVNVWHHWVMTGDGTSCKVYQDGIYWGVAKTYKSISGTSIYINGWSSGTDYCSDNLSISDFRIYATALSAEDVLDLYHTSANIDNLQNIHAFELKEQSGNLFAGSPMTGTMTWDATNNYYTITSNPSTSTWGIGPAVGTSPKKIIPWGMSYILTYEVYSPTAAQWYIDYNNNDPTTSLSGNDNDNNRLRTGVNVPANTWTLITYGCSNTNETKNPDHLPLYDYSTGLGPVMTNISSAITWHMRNPQWYLVDADNKEHIYESGVFQANFIKEDNQSLYTSFRNEEKAVWAHGYIEK